MSLTVPLPRAMRDLVGLNTHPGLALDRFAASYLPGGTISGFSEAVQRPTVEQVARLTASAPADLFADLRARRDATLKHLNAQTLDAETAGPFTLHLARASALENAGVCLHPLYGFVFLPGSGVKGLARAYATLSGAPEECILKVFGRAAGDGGDSAGAVVFHDAWPTRWPCLQTDILNSHHGDYYGDETGSKPPGDWESPNPVYFLSVPAGEAFTFAVSARRDEHQRYVQQALEWLAGGLTSLGAGAKTASGYGHFGILNGVEALPEPPKARVSEAVTLELVTPAFLAGADQESADGCDLRPATLRGLLRWWWRTMHVGYVDTPTLKKMEAAVWGDTRAGGAVRVTVEPNGKARPLRYNRDRVARENQLPRPPDNRTTQGLTYHSFGMDDNRGAPGQPPRRVTRWYCPPGTSWKVRLTARPVKRNEKDKIPAADLLNQARMALWLLCHYGGVGAKSRRGFGSLADPQELNSISRESCRESANKFRQEFGFAQANFNPDLAESPSLKQTLPFEDVPTGWGNVWVALDQIAAAAQAFAQAHKHRNEKKALGLPRDSRGGSQGPFPVPLFAKARHASPVLYHIGKADDGLVVRVTVFPARHLPNLAASREFLSRLLDELREHLPGRFAAFAAAGGPPPGQPAAPAGQALPSSGAVVRAVLLADKTSNGGWRARLANGTLAGHLVNTADVPADAAPDQEVQLVVASINPRQISFRWPSAADLAKAAAPKPPPKPGGGKGGPPRRR